MDYFDKTDPWHINADFLFGFQCESCDNQIGLDDVEEKEFSQQCVQMSNLAKEEGWKCIEEYKFICRECVKENEEH